ADQERLRKQHENQRARKLLSIHQAREQRQTLAFGKDQIAVPAFLGRKVLADVPLADLVPYIDWRFFFSAWELKGDVPAIFDDPAQGQTARELYDRAEELLKLVSRDRSIKARGVYGFWPAVADGDDVVLYEDTSLAREVARFPMLRQQLDRGAGEHTTSLADFVAPCESGVVDYVGAFAVTGGIGAEELAKHFERDHDDYSAIIVKALADRFAEAFAELLHERARRELGYGEREKLSQAELVAEKYRGIRPAFGYPACPDHTEKRTLFALLGAEEVGIGLTEHMAMTPAASVSGLYFAHPGSHYFNVSSVARDQVEDYARRKGMSVAEVERWLLPNLAYDPD
ncbi:MAG TPA: vitamin B12 dependent-methionine synthase activation domain-containing protein, partial [Polyangiaceae bacterium]|nr:vitamin B12 dependent-methionine synthase activation domain-containing protein [Polyangiaceae bacterium]